MVTNTKLSVAIDQLLVGNIVPFGPNGKPSGIQKRPVTGPTAVTTLGLVGDHQADKRFHGGITKAIHHYPAEHYQRLKDQFPDFPTAIGGFGENLTSTGITEKEVCLNDVYSLGSAVVQLTQGRQPCWKLNVRFGHSNMATIIQKHGWTGWYYRVIEEGIVAPGDKLSLLARPYPEANLDRIQHFLHREPMNTQAMAELLTLPVWPPGWRKIFETRIRTGLKEDETARLQTPAPRR